MTILSDDFSAYRPELYLDARFDVLDGYAVKPESGGLNMSPLALGYPTFTLDIDQTVDNDEVLGESVNLPWYVLILISGFESSFTPLDGEGLTAQGQFIMQRGGLGFGEDPGPGDDTIDMVLSDPFTEQYHEVRSVPGGTMPLRMRISLNVAPGAGLLLVTDRDDDSDVFRLALPDVGTYYAAITSVQSGTDSSILLNHVGLTAMRYEGDCRVTTQGAELWTFADCGSPPLLAPWPYPTPNMTVSAGAPSAVRVAR